MKKLILVIGLCSTACASQWVQQGKTERDLLNDKTACRVAAGQATGQARAKFHEYFVDCMLGKGWEDVD